jgi:glycosyltransferase involved in cell wall biosynthesis
LNKPAIYFVATVEFTINAFLKQHLSLLSKTFNVTVVVNTPNPSFLKKQGINVNVIPLNIKRNINIFSDLGALFSLFYLFLKNRPVSVHSITPKAGLLAMAAAYMARVPFKVHTFTGQVWVTKRGVFRYILKKLDTMTAFFSDYAIVDSPSQSQFLVKEKVLPHKKSIVFGSGSISGVDLDKFKPCKKTYADVRSELSIPDDAFVFVYIGRLNADKGILDLATAFSKIHDNKAYLVVVGPDEGDYTQKIENLSNLNLGHVRLIGFSSKPYRYLAASDALCLPSYREGFGSVIIEAAAMGVPAIASNIYGISDAIINKQTGILHTPGNVKSILDAMEHFLKKPELVKKYGNVAMKRAKADFDANTISKYWRDFYFQMLRNDDALP